MSYEYEDAEPLYPEGDSLLHKRKRGTRIATPVTPVFDQQNKADAGKSNPLLLEVDLAEALEAVNVVLDYGAEKYERAGWKKVEPARYDAAARRHRRARDKGQVRDFESDLLHLAHEATNLLFQLQLMIEANTDLNYRTYNQPPQGHKS